MKRALVILAEDFEELEAITTMDLLVRAKVEVVSAGLQAGPVRASRNTVVMPSTDLDQVLDEVFDLIVLPGGLPGADHLADDTRVQSLLRRQMDRRQLLGVICAAPRALFAAGIAHGRTITSYPGTLDHLDIGSTTVTGNAVEVDLPLITSRGPGTAMDFALTLVEHLQGKAVRDEVEKALARS